MRTSLIIMLILIAVFAAFPELDILVSQQFYVPEQGFIFRDHIAAVILYEAVMLLTTVYIIVILSYFFLSFHRPAFDAIRTAVLIAPSRTATLYLILSLAIGPGLIVHQGFKDHWERARPKNTEVFGGTQAYSPPLQPSDQGGKSFVSGHGAMGFYLFSFALVTYGALRRRWMIAGVAAGLIIGCGRIAQGGHFLSDIVFSGCITILWAYACHWILIGRNKKNNSTQPNTA